MKRYFSMLMAFVMCLSLCACGSGEKKTGEAVSESVVESQSTTAVEMQTLYNIGDTVSTDAIELTLTSVEFMEKYSICTPADGQFIVAKFSMKNIGKKEVRIAPATYAPSVDYNNGYIFTWGDVSGKDGKYDRSVFASDDLLELKPLSDAVMVKVAINVPMEVVENTDAPLLLKLLIPAFNGNDFYTGESFSFSIR